MGFPRWRYPRYYDQDPAYESLHDLKEVVARHGTPRSQSSLMPILGARWWVMKLAAGAVKWPP
jgi:hypothetical protein